MSENETVFTPEFAPTSTGDSNSTTTILIPVIGAIVAGAIAVGVKVFRRTKNVPTTLTLVHDEAPASE